MHEVIVTVRSITGGQVLRQAFQAIGRQFFRGDEAYDDFRLRETPGEEVTQIIPLSKDAVIHKRAAKKPLAGYLNQRNEAVGMIAEKKSKMWKEQNGYHMRKLNEVSMYRYKTIFGGSLSHR